MITVSPIANPRIQSPQGLSKTASGAMRFGSSGPPPPPPEPFSLGRLFTGGYDGAIGKGARVLGIFLFCIALWALPVGLISYSKYQEYQERHKDDNKKDKKHGKHEDEHSSHHPHETHEHRHVAGAHGIHDDHDDHRDVHDLGDVLDHVMKKQRTSSGPNPFMPPGINPPD